MCDSAKSFNQDISKWDVCQVTSMSGMFFFGSFDGDISKWDVSRVTEMSLMFNGTTSFSQSLCGKAWVKSKARKTDMFDGSSGSISMTACGLCLVEIILMLSPHLIHPHPLHATAP